MPDILRGCAGDKQYFFSDDSSEREGIVSNKVTKKIQAEYSFVFPEEWWYPVDLRDGWSPYVFPQTLGEFHKWWDTLQRVHQIHLSSVVSAGGMRLYGRTKQDDPCVWVSQQFGAKSFKQINFTVRFDTFFAKGIPWVGYRDRGGFIVGYMGGDGNSTFFFPISQYEVVDFDQDQLILYFKAWHLGLFEKSFSDLAQAANELEYLRFEEIQRLIFPDATKGDEVFEAFGMKFPVGKATSWGIVLLLSVQVYFFIYIRQLWGKLRPDDPGWDVPWVGMDPSRISQTIMFCSMVLLPICTIVLLVYQPLHAKQFLSDTTWLRRTEYLGLTLALGASICMGLLSWYYRPKLEPQEPPAPTPLFY
jgi:hypothetical protein